MTLDYEIIGITVLWSFLYLYVIIASIDFGAGFFNFYSKLTGDDNIISPIISRYLNPVWETTNVFFVFFFVGIVGFYPDTAYYLGTTLLLPGSIALILLSIRGAYYAFNSYNTERKLTWDALYGITGLLIPASLSIALVISEGGYIKETAEGIDLMVDELLFSTYGWSVVFLAIISVLYISSGFLTFYAAKAEDKKATDLTRTWYLIWTLPTLVITQFVFLGLRDHNPVHFENAQNYWYLFGLSLLAMLIAVYLIYRRRNYGTAFVMIMLQYGFAFFGYGISKLPYIVYPYIDISTSIVNENMAFALTIVFALGLLLLIPSIVLLARLFLFDKDYVKGNKKY
ncbi:cytochrome d ubiquinol oxidase subunit II [Jeotgalicoccus meleagridis]|uniref:Cytochrome bd menaquinol oxidase subunit II n=1 Tax=Jeotgalicoccus meleagridis TaxID=2759181 RepID=A0A6V7RPN8_9STAP|nr:cytochrome d ubiquinol oxidase subunit II [Jeotgalicoccus meleagridis]CAD2079584.1 Putative cytochrome bd menaquinol oxidase subunit II [Jeotgalicoccus meleagridis]HIW38430.1 cytochrome d ubiquinol oxidase subunit II [Candidatus Jeotgalicoccus stercoravium]